MGHCCSSCLSFSFCHSRRESASKGRELRLTPFLLLGLLLPAITRWDGVRSTQKRRQRSVRLPAFNWWTIQSRKWESASSLRSSASTRSLFAPRDEPPWASSCRISTTTRWLLCGSLRKIPRTLQKMRHCYGKLVSKIKAKGPVIQPGPLLLRMVSIWDSGPTRETETMASDSLQYARRTNLTL